MKTINFKEFTVYTDIARSKPVTDDIRVKFADLLYSRSTGIVAHNLAYKIYNSDGEVEIDEKEEMAILQFVNSICSPSVIDGITDQLNK